MSRRTRTRATQAPGANAPRAEYREPQANEALRALLLRAIGTLLEPADTRGESAREPALGIGGGMAACAGEVVPGHPHAALNVLERAGIGVLFLDAADRIEEVDTTTASRLAAVLGESVQRGCLPSRLRVWLTGAKRAARGGRSPSLVLWETPGARGLQVRYVPARAPAERNALLVQVVEPPLRRSELEGLGLTPREAEVLFWVARGKTNGEIGTILCISARTVQKHLEHIYRKSNTSSRAAAVAWAAGT